MPFFDKYPYTNFHNVNLDWVLEEVKKWGTMVEDNNTRFEDLNTAFEEFKTYVKNYLEDLDVQGAIDDKLDRMFESGELTDYLQPYVSTTVTTWLDENITEPTGVVIDSSLTVAGACADAKATGLVSFPLQAKNDLINCLMDVAWTTPNGKNLTIELEKSLFQYSIYEKYLWKLSLNELSAVHCAGTVSQFIDGNVWLALSSAGVNADRRRCIVIDRGRKPFIDYATGLELKYYPIPIPKDATGCIVYGNLNSFYFGIDACVYDSNNNIYKALPNGTNIITLPTLGRIEKTFAFVPDNAFMMCNMKAGSTGTETFEPNQPLEVTIEFTRN